MFLKVCAVAGRSRLDDSEGVVMEEKLEGEFDDDDDDEGDVDDQV